jgi:hypothetical protein
MKLANLQRASLKKKRSLFNKISPAKSNRKARKNRRKK